MLGDESEIGSYVISVVCPFAELDNNNQYQQLSIFSDEERCQKSFTRKVTKRLMKNISSVKQYIDNNKNFIIRLNRPPIKDCI